MGQASTAVACPPAPGGLGWAVPFDPPGGSRKPVAVVMDFKDATLDHCDQIIEKMGFTPGGAGAPGGLFHWVTATDDGVRVVDVRETREHVERFAGEQIGPYSQEVGILNPPDINFYDVHNHLTAGSSGSPRARPSPRLLGRGTEREPVCRLPAPPPPRASLVGAAARTPWPFASLSFPVEPGSHQETARFKSGSRVEVRLQGRARPGQSEQRTRSVSGPDRETFGGVAHDRGERRRDRRARSPAATGPRSEMLMHLSHE